MIQPYFANIPLLLLLAFSQSTKSAVVRHHPLSVWESSQREEASNPPPLMLFWRTAQIQTTDDEDSSLRQEARSWSESKRSEEHSESRNIMMISTSTISSSSFEGAKGFADGDDSEGVLSIDMTIIQFDEFPSVEDRKIPGRLALKRPLFIESSPTKEQHPTPEPQETLATNQSHQPDNLANESPIRKMNEFLKPWNKSTTFQWPEAIKRASPTTTTTSDKPKSSYQQPPAEKPTEPDTFNTAAKNQIFLGSSPEFDCNSHHSQL